MARINIEEHPHFRYIDISDTADAIAIDNKNATMLLTLINLIFLSIYFLLLPVNLRP